MTSIRTALMLLWVAACGGDITGSTTNGTRVVLDLRSLLGAQAQPGDFASVVASGTLTIASGGQQTTLTQALADNEPVVTFNVAVKSGAANFTMEVASNNQTVLYRGQASATIENDGFMVPITLQPVGAPVMVLARRVPVAFTSDSVQVEVRNRGSATLTWFVDSLASQNVVSCHPHSVPTSSCLGPASSALTAGVVDTASIQFQIAAGQPRPTSRAVVFGSGVGTATVNVTIP